MTTIALPRTAPDQNPVAKTAMTRRRFLTGGAGLVGLSGTATAVYAGVYDTAGLGIGQPVTNIFGKATNFGQDIGGGGPLTGAPNPYSIAPSGEISLEG